MDISQQQYAESFSGGMAVTRAASVGPSQEPMPTAARETMLMTLTERERQFLIELLQGEVAELRSENYHAESHDVKEFLKEREACAKSLLQRLQTGEAP